MVSFLKYTRVMGKFTASNGIEVELRNALHLDDRKLDHAFAVAAQEFFDHDSQARRV